jgi:hypothetical protein
MDASKTAAGTCELPLEGDRTAVGARSTDVRSWAEEERLLEALAAREGPPAALARLKLLLSAHPAATDAWLLAGRTLSALGREESALGMFSHAAALALPGTLTWSHPDTRAVIAAQLALDPARRPATARAEENLRRNAAALGEVDAEAAGAVLRASDPPDTQIIEVWGRLHIANPRTCRVALESQQALEDLRPLLGNRAAIAFFGPGSGREVLHVLRRSPDLLLGMRRIVYLFEKDARLLRNFLRLEDISGEIRSRRLAIFGGEGWSQAAEKLFSTRRYPVPAVALGDKTPYLPDVDRLPGYLAAGPVEAKEVADYYASPAFAGRLREIAAGRALPRVLFLTCRWTTVLQHVCADFRRGFEDLGCAVETVIEESDVQELSHGCYGDAVRRLKPDLAFSVTHARPSYRFLPDKLPFACFFMDRVQPIVDLARLDDRIRPADLFFCMFDDFIRYLAGKRVPREQLSLLATPADDRVYHPLDPGDPLLERYASEVSWVKHGGPDAARCLEEFLASLLGRPDDPLQLRARPAFAAVHAKVHAANRFFTDAEVLEMVRAELRGPPPEWTEKLKALVTQYMVNVYSLDFRQRFLRPLAEAGLRLRLFGNGWDRHPVFRSHAAGPVARGEPLNAVYNASAINLHIHTIGAMHQRLAEGALAGGFFLANRVEDPAWEGLDPYFEEGREVVTFTSEKDLLEKCRHFLAHPDERRAIAERMRQRALRDLTVKAAAGRVLAKFRERLTALDS